MIFDNLVFDDAHARLLDSHLGKRNTGFIGRECRRTEYLVNLFLCVGRILLLRLFHLGDDVIHLLDVFSFGCGVDHNDRRVLCGYLFFVFLAHMSLLFG